MGTNHDSGGKSDHPVGSGDDLIEIEEDLQPLDNNGGSDAEVIMDSDSDSDFSSAGSSSDSDDGVGGSGEDVKGEVDEEDDLDDEDPVIKAINKAKEKKDSNHPPDLVLEGIPSTLCFHPVDEKILFGNYEGELLLYGYSNDDNRKLAQSQHKGSSVRTVSFTRDGQKLISAFSDHTLKFYDVKDEELELKRTILNATSAPASAIYVIDENVLATGDDDGNLLLWDMRSSQDTPTASHRLGEDAITSMTTNEDQSILVCTSEEGAVYSVKIRGGKVLVESEIYDYEFNCSCVFKQEKKLAVGDGKGDVYIFNWGEFGKHSDICTGIGRKEAINAMIPITERIILFGGDDGFIRAFHFFPQKYLGVVGKLGHPVEKMDVCNDGHLIASLGADETVKFWNVKYFENITVPTGPAANKGGDTKEKSNNSGNRKGSKKQKDVDERQDLNKHNLPSSSHQNASDFFKGLAD